MARARREAAARSTTPWAVIMASVSSYSVRRSPRARRVRVSRLRRAHDPRAAHAVGVLLVERGDVVQLAPAAGARRGARRRGRARGLPPRDRRPLAALLGAAGVARARLAHARALAAPLRTRARAVSGAAQAAARASSI